MRSAIQIDRQMLVARELASAMLPGSRTLNDAHSRLADFFHALGSETTARLPVRALDLQPSEENWRNAACALELVLKQTAAGTHPVRGVERST